MIHKFTCLSFIMFVLTGCVIEAKYYNHEQNISVADISNKIPNSNFETDLKLENNKVFLNRYSWFDKEIIVKKEGFKDYHIKLDNVWTNEPWAKEGEVFHFKPSESTSAISFLNPLYVLQIPLGLFVAIGYPDTLGDSDFYAFTFAFPINITNFFGTTILNPWTKYEIQTGDLILTPTEELQQSCHLKKNYFISNHGCLPCNSDVKNPISSEEECLRCSNRKWISTECQIK